MSDLPGLVSEYLSFREARGLQPNQKLERLLLQGKYSTQVLLAEDQHPVGDLGPHCQDETFGETVRPRLSG
ncbi:MAG: hypothetical protein JOY78_07015 [Pseudonocardia sp.]|nr:hypothetical protein [Pseudonocardia sp.]